MIIRVTILGPALRQVRFEENKLPDFLVIYNTFLGQYSDSRGELIISVSCTYMWLPHDKRTNDSDKKTLLIGELIINLSSLFVFGWNYHDCNQI